MEGPTCGQPGCSLATLFAVRKAEKQKEECVEEIKQSFQREQESLKSEVDGEVRKLNDLYAERCQDYAQMVSDECEADVSKRVKGATNASQSRP